MFVAFHIEAVWEGEDSNLRRLSQQIYSLPHLTALEPSLKRADRRTRTADRLITNQLLYQLSYIGNRSMCFPYLRDCKNNIFFNSNNPQIKFIHIFLQIQLYQINTIIKKRFFLHKTSYFSQFFPLSNQILEFLRQGIYKNKSNLSL